MKYSSLLLTALLGAAAHAQENIPSFETVVEDVVFNTSNKVVIDEETIKESRAPNITTLLSSQANITVTSTPFQPNSIFIRGGDSSHVMIIVDGVPFYDASTIQRTFNLNSLDIKSVRRIEIIKGGQTVLYGGQALSGVIKIDTIPQEFKTKTGLEGQIGTQNFRDITAVHTEALDENNAFIVRGHGAWRDAESPVLGSSETYARNNWNAEGTYAWKGAVEGNLKALFLQDLNESPASSRVNNRIYDTVDFDQFTRQIGVSSNLRFTQTAWEPRLALSTQNSLRDYDWPTVVPVDNPTGTEEDYGANLRTVRLDFTPYKGDNLTVIGGLSYIYEDFVFRSKGVEQVNTFSEQRGLFLKGDYAWNKDFSLALGGRVENWGDQDPVGTFQVGLTLFEHTKLEVASGYKIPSLFQLYSRYGNPDLKAENANQYSLMQEWNINESQNLSVTLFYSEFSNLLQITGSPGNMKYNNVAKSETRGVDVAYTIRPFTDASVVATYGYQEPRDLENDRWLLRRPLVNGSLRYIQAWGKHSGSVELIGAGTRSDFGATGIVTLPGYVTANAAYSYALNEKMTVYTRLNNLADHRYEETYTYYSEGFNGSLGGEYWF
ncbi:outer membrane receptor protein [Bdellovibrio bacteriovorus]|uniref:Outer membrane receptor protein n=1 Tax=Bdellovibrio bacteriovorus TaxID=959 RepID=A0A161PTE7_BDEBC|nr:TonB-dependent receptor [Bdellovibrio bacteriovorus]KYG68036.1 outer membrane receptor protein [Bdellovibrio bacteriovorus]